ncbi:hypothetical protein EDC04DRAFT_2604205 [Pisolithus marmoratus]|nr:hypothetical protein EDC04DRAFT_2604205 [Pisolithus marmoratus]
MTGFDFSCFPPLQLSGLLSFVVKTLLVTPVMVWLYLILAPNAPNDSAAALPENQASRDDILDPTHFTYLYLAQHLKPRWLLVELVVKPNKVPVTAWGLLEGGATTPSPTSDACYPEDSPYLAHPTATCNSSTPLRPSIIPLRADPSEQCANLSIAQFKVGVFADDASVSYLTTMPSFHPQIMPMFHLCGMVKQDQREDDLLYQWLGLTMTTPLQEDRVVQLCVRVDLKFALPELVNIARLLQTSSIVEFHSAASGFTVGSSSGQGRSHSQIKSHLKGALGNKQISNPNGREMVPSPRESPIPKLQYDQYLDNNFYMTARYSIKMERHGTTYQSTG